MSLALGGNNIYSTNLNSGAVNRSYFGVVVVHGKLPEEEPTPEPIYDYYVSELGDGVGTIEDPMSFVDSQTTINSMTAGQSIAYKGGDEFYGGLDISGVNGTNGNPITITSYGTGQANFIGSTPLTSWSNESTNIWSAAVGTDVYQVFKDNVKLLNTRSDYLTITLDNSTTQFQSDDLIGYGTMDSGTAIMFTTVEWLYELSTVSNFDSTTGTVTLSSAPSKGFDVGTEFLVVNNSKELVDGSWSYDTTNNKLYIYSTISPINITATSNTNNGIRPIASYITFDNIVVSQFGGKGIFIEGSDVIINNCLVKDNFDSGITNYNQGERITITNSEISGINGGGISIACNNSVIEYNTVHSIGTASDMTYKKVTNTSGMGVSGSNSSMSYNTLYNLGYNGIVPNGQYTTVQRNIISDFNTFLTDGAAIYTHTGSTDGIWNIAKALGSVIRNNIITGSDEIKKEPSFGVYLDDCTTDVTVTENTISECATGIYFHNSKRNVASLNNLYYNGVGLVMREEANGDNNGGTNENDGEMVDNIASQNNIFLFSNTYGEGAITLHSTYGNMDLYTGTDNIIHNEGSLFPFRVSMQLVWQGPFIEYSLSDFQTLTGNEIGSTQNTTRQDPFTIDSYDTANTVPNPETGTTGWSATTGSITNPGGYLKLTPTAASTKAKANQTSGNAAFTTGRQMLVEFDVQSGSTIPMAWYLQNQSTPFLNTGEQWNIHPEATWNSYRYIWQSTFTLPNVNIQIFAMEDDEFDFDNVSVREVTLGTPPEVSFLASNDTNVSSDIALPTGTWVAMSDGTNYTGTISIEPYSSEILALLQPTYTVSNTDGTADYSDIATLLATETLVAGDIIGLKGGDEFYESVTISGVNGSSGSPITITSYGTGQAVVKGTTPITVWNDLGGNIWESTVSSSMGQVLKNGVPLPISKLPKTADIGSPKSSTYVVTSGSGLTFISDDLKIANGFTGDLTGATVHISSALWRLEARTITAFNNTTGEITISSTVGYSIDAGDTFLVVNDESLMTLQDEWVHIGTSLKIYSVLEPSNIEVTTETDAITLSTSSYITLDNLKIEGFKGTGIKSTSSNITINNCEINYTHLVGVDESGGGFTISNSIIKGANYRSITSTSSNAQILNNHISENGLFKNIATANYNNMFGIKLGGSGTTVSGNTLTDMGYVGIELLNTNGTVENNYITKHCLTLQDGAAIYTYNGVSDGTVVQYNVVDGLLFDSPTWYSSGVYLDDRTTDVVVDNNSLSNVYHGVFLHNTSNCTITNNKIYRTQGYSLYLKADTNGDGEGTMVGNTVQYNEIFSTDKDVTAFATRNDYPGGTNYNFGTYDFNTLVNPYTRKRVSLLTPAIYSTVGTYEPRPFGLSEWQSFASPQDANSTEMNLDWDSFTIESYDGANLIPNPDFEIDLTGWSAAISGSIARVERDDIPGNYCVEMTDGGYGKLLPQNAVVGTGTYVLEFEAQCDELLQIRVTIAEQGGDTYMSEYIYPTSDWTTFRFEFNSTKAQNLNTGLWMFDVDSNSNVKLRVDNYTVKEATTSLEEERHTMVYNETDTVLDEALPSGTWDSLDGTQTNKVGTVTVAAYSSYIMIKQ